MIYAHTQDGVGPEHWEPLECHLQNVAELSQHFAEAFRAGPWGKLAGLWHDLGKYSEVFQQYLHSSSGEDAHLEQRSGRVDHSTAGAQHAWRMLGEPAGRFLAYCIAGHHAGLPDAETDSDSSLAIRLTKRVPSIECAPDSILTRTTPGMPNFRWAAGKRDRSFQASVFCRMLFSCLVDADFLATEAFVAPERTRERPSASPKMADLESQVLSHIQAMADRAESSELNRHRERILEACLAGAAWKPGLFSLTVPTGGGKTLASLAMALRHARIHDLRRVIYAIPFTSIIEQNAEVFRNALGPWANLVLEHHSNLDPEQETKQSRLASENWDAPVVATWARISSTSSSPVAVSASSLRAARTSGESTPRTSRSWANSTAASAPIATNSSR